MNYDGVILKMILKIGSKKAGSYIDFVKHNPANDIEIMSKGSYNSKAVYIAAILSNRDYFIDNVDIGTENIGKKEPLAVLNISLRAKNGSKYKT